MRRIRQKQNGTNHRKIRQELRLSTESARVHPILRPAEGAVILILIIFHQCSVLSLFIHAYVYISSKAIVRQKFEFHDRDGDGYIDRNEAVRMLEPNGFVEARWKIVRVSPKQCSLVRLPAKLNS